MNDHAPTSMNSGGGLSRNARIVILLVAFLAWFFGGMQILLTNLGMRAASIDLVGQVGQIDLPQFSELTQSAATLAGEQKQQLDAWNELAAQWYAWFQCAF